MAYINSTIYSNVLRQEVALDLFLPNDKPDLGIIEPQGVIYFLHGLGSSEKRFREYTAVNRYAADNDLAMVYVSAPQSFYNDMKYGLPYYTYITEELPQLLKSLYNIDFPREKTFIAGLSMGGYGAFRIGLSKPEMFAGVASLSGACDIRMMAETVKKMPVIEGDTKSFIPAFGEDCDIKDEQDLYYLAKKVAEMPKEKQPRIALMTGKQDDLFFLHDQAKALGEYMKGLDLREFKYMAWDGVHDYTFWDRAILHTISYFLQNDYDKKQIELWTTEATL